jgi:hypothetical protein
MCCGHDDSAAAAARLHDEATAVTDSNHASPGWLANMASRKRRRA